MSSKTMNKVLNPHKVAKEDEQVPLQCAPPTHNASKPNSSSPPRHVSQERSIRHNQYAVPATATSETGARLTAPWSEGGGYGKFSQTTTKILGCVESDAYALKDADSK